MFKILFCFQNLRTPKIDFRRTLGETYTWYLDIVNIKPKKNLAIAEISKSYSLDESP